MLVSRDPLEKLQEKRMGWSLSWASTMGSEFNRELGFLHMRTSVPTAMRVPWLVLAGRRSRRAMTTETGSGRPIAMLSATRASKGCGRCGGGRRRRCG